ncbi:MAG TPA: hypothetical protein PLT91_00650 [Clostridia bacterium]|jgi:hypothetical protein|nr:hypothetical protein [Clostridia bacterium]HQM38730.1 hypothetical protein [Clostridia bacterium]
MRTEIAYIADYLDKVVTDPIPRYILDKEIYNRHVTGYEKSKWYTQLLSEQMDNGSWGRFHTQNTKLKDKKIFVTTESALIRTRELTLPVNDPVITKVIKLMERYVNDEENWTDANEHHYGFQIAFKAIIVANISTFIPDHPLVIPKKEVCALNLRKAFKNGCLDEEVWEKENRLSNEILLKPYMVYILWLLQKNKYLDDETQLNFLNYIWYRKQGIYYRTNMPVSDVQRLESKYFSCWFTGLENLKDFSLFPEFLDKGIYRHLINEVNRLMREDITLPASTSVSNHYSESWRDKSSRDNDMILRILRILIMC